MNLRQLGGLALLANTVIGILLSVESVISGSNTPTPITIVQLIGFLLFIAGLPAIQALQPQTGRLGQVGLVLLGLGAGIAFIVVAQYLVGSNSSEVLVLSSAVTGTLGSILVGWVTARAGVFPSWIGWSLLVTGILNFGTVFLPSGTFANVVGFLVGLAMSIPIAGYGWILVQRGRASYAEQRPAGA